MTDGRDRFVFPEKVPCEFKRVLVHAECIRIKQAAGDHECVELFRARIFYGKIDIEFVTFICVIHSLNLAGLQRNDFRLCTGFI